MAIASAEPASVEPKRLESLRELRLLDSPRNASFDRITDYCVDSFACSTALITLVDETRQWFLSSVGVDTKETPRALSFGDHAIASKSSLLVSNALEDERFSEFPHVRGAPGIRSYLGVPIRSSSGEIIGTLCVADQRVDLFAEHHIPKLEALAATVEDLIGAHSQALLASHLGANLNLQGSLIGRSNQIFKQAEKIAKIGSWELDLETECLTWSNESFVIFGSPENPPQSIAETFSYYAREDQEKVAEAVQQIIEHHGSFVFEAGLNAADGTFKQVKAMGEYLEGGEHGGPRLVGIIQDITDANHARLALQRAADRDALTDLYNRNAFDRILRDRLREIKKTDSAAFLIMIDLDGFKDINDVFGHLVGDVVLEEVGSRILGALPHGATVARWGGDEFVVITASTMGLEDARQLGDDILLAINRQFEISGRRMAIGATCGVAEITGQATSREIIRKADLALYRGKEREPGRVHCYFPEMEEANHHRQAAIAKVRDALANDNLFAGYQPIMDIATNRLVGLEALMRLSSASGAPITATEVLPALLDPILSREIGDRMLSCVCNDMAQIEQAQPGLQFISLNATEADLLSRDFADKFFSSLQSARINPEKVTLEITETMLMVNDTATVQSVLVELGAAGVSIALDDFGTGFSSLSHLRDFPIDKVKIDQSFIKTLAYDHQTRLIVQALINMASNIGVVVIAEGIETEDQRNILLQQGCNLGQGFLFSPAETPCRIKTMRFKNREDKVFAGPWPLEL